MLFLESSIWSVSDCDLQSAIYHDINVYQNQVVVRLKSTFHTHVFQKNHGKTKRIGYLLLFMAPFALCTSMSQRGDAVAHGRAHEGNWQKRFLADPKNPSTAPSTPSSSHGCMEANGKASQGGNKNLPNLRSKGLVYY